MKQKPGERQYANLHEELSINWNHGVEASPMTKPVDNPASPDRIISETGSTRYQFGLRAIGALGLGIVFVVSFMLKPSGAGLSTCAFRNAFGIPCPGCGLTRSFAAISHGFFGAAFRMHPLGPAIYAGFALYMVKWAAEAVLHRRLFARIENRLRIPVLWSLLAAMIAVWAWRLATGSSG
jgi:hypothetical protein